MAQDEQVGLYIQNCFPTFGSRHQQFPCPSHQQGKKRRCWHYFFFFFNRTSFLIILHSPERNHTIIPSFKERIKKNRSSWETMRWGWNIIRAGQQMQNVLNQRIQRNPQSSARQCWKRNVVTRKLNRTYFLTK